MLLYVIDSDVPVVCINEKPYQLLGEAREALLMRLGNTH